MTLPLISVMIDTYNYGCLIEEANEGVLSQNVSADQMEILVVDDGSTDDATKRKKKYGTKSRYFRKENGGQVSASNLGLSRSRCGIICFLDADDLWLPNKIGSVAEAFENNPAGMVSNSYELSGPDSSGPRKPEVNFVSGDISKNLESLLRYRIFPTSCLSFCRVTPGRLMPIQETIRLQTDAFLAVLAVFIAPVSTLPESLDIYGTHYNNLLCVSAAQRTPKSQRRINLMWEVVFREMSFWLQRNEFNPQPPSIRTFLDQWEPFRRIAEFWNLT